MLHFFIHWLCSGLYPFHETRNLIEFQCLWASKIFCTSYSSLSPTTSGGGGHGLHWAAYNASLKGINKSWLKTRWMSFQLSGRSNWYAACPIFSTTSNRPYHFGPSFFDWRMLCRLDASSHTLSLGLYSWAGFFHRLQCCLVVSAAMLAEADASFHAQSKSFKKSVMLLLLPGWLLVSPFQGWHP